MKIEKNKYKTKIILEYHNSFNFGTISKDDLNKLYFKVFLEDGSVIMVDEIKQITFAIKDMGVENEQM
jgi:hypothetical protein